MTISGELPEEIVGIIRAFSKPCLRFPNAYKDVCETLELKHWPELMKKLSGPGDEPKKVLAVVKVFLTAHKGYTQASKACEHLLENRARKQAFSDMLGPANDSLLMTVFGKKPPYSWWYKYADE